MIYMSRCSKGSSFAKFGVPATIDTAYTVYIPYMLYVINNLAVYTLNIMQKYPVHKSCMITYRNHRIPYSIVQALVHIDSHGK